MGGAIALWEATATVTNSILWANEADDGPQVAIFGDVGAPSVLSISHCDVQGGQEAVYIDPNSVLNWDDLNNIDVDPCFAVPGYWHPNSTPNDINDDFWVDGGYHLKSQTGRWSPSIYARLDPTQDGFVNATDFAALAENFRQKGGFLPGDLDYTGVVDFNDLRLLLDGYLAGYAPGTWVLDQLSSLCIDAGDPNSPVGAEPLPNGGRINMGAYGGTEQASKSLTCWHTDACAGQPLGDANCDGEVDFIDLGLMKYSYFTCKGDPDYKCCADFNHDECVGFIDLGILKANFFTAGHSPATGNQDCPP
jgi:hypothetical protein